MELLGTQLEVTHFKCQLLLSMRWMTIFCKEIVEQNLSILSHFRIKHEFFR